MKTPRAPSQKKTAAAPPAPAKRKKSSKANRAWVHEHITDPYVRLAQKEGYRARAAYKLKEIDESCRLLRPGCRVVDLGAAPGAWSQYVRHRLAGKGAAPGALPGLIVALDVLPMEPIEGVLFIRGDVREEATLARLHEACGGQPLDVVLSDMAPNLSGIAASDAARVAHLVELAIEFATAHLAAHGALLVKLFHGSGYSQLVRLFKDHFHEVRAIKPRASRERSAETYVLARRPKNPCLPEGGTARNP